MNTQKTNKNTAYQSVSIYNLSKMHDMFNNWLEIRKEGVFCRPNKQNAQKGKKKALNHKPQTDQTLKIAKLKTEKLFFDADLDNFGRFGEGA